LAADPSKEKITPHFKQHRPKHNSRRVVLCRSDGKVLQRSDPDPTDRPPLTENEAFQLCKNKLQKLRNARPGEREKMISEIKRLCSCLDYNRTAVEQSIAYLNKMTGDESIADFIEKYKQRVEVFEKKEEQVGDEYSYPVATVFDLSMDWIAKTDSALEMLYFLSFSAAEATPIELFEYLYGGTTARKAFATLYELNLAGSCLRVRKRTSAATLDFNDLMGTEDEESEDEEGTNCIYVDKAIQKIVQELVMERVELIEVVFQAAFINQTGDGFQIMQFFTENKQQVNNPECDLHFIFLHHWDFVHTDDLAASAVMMTAFCRLDKVFPWKGVFGKEKWADARCVLEQTCFRSLSLYDEDYNYSFSDDVHDFIRQLTEQDRNSRSLLLSSISFAITSLEDKSKWTEFNLTHGRRKHHIKTFKKVQHELQVTFS